MPIDWLSRFQNENAVWRMSGSSVTLPHIKTSMLGEHVDAYFNSDIIASQPLVLDQIIETVLVPALEKIKVKPDWVFSYAPYGLFITYAAAQRFKARCGYTLPSDDYKTSFGIPGSASVLVVADDMYSGSGALKTIATLEHMKINVLPIVFCLANMTGASELGNRNIVSAINIPTKRYSADKCELCKGGSEALVARPNWTQLTKS